LAVVSWSFFSSAAVHFFEQEESGIGKLVTEVFGVVEVGLSGVLCPDGVNNQMASRQLNR
jgi:hypothetical protein